MTETLTISNDLFPLTRELHRFVTHLQRPRVADGKWAEAVHLKCHELSEKVTSARQCVEDHRRALCLSLERISGNLCAYALELEESRNIIRLKETYQSLTQGYELLRVELEAFRKQHAVSKTLRTQRLKTDNYARNVFHITMGLTAVLLYEYVLSYRQASILILSLCAIALALEATRRFLPRWNDFMVDRVFGAVSRPWERHQTNSSTYYTIGLSLATLFFPKPAAQTAVLVLAFGDPMATLIGKRWGTRKIWHEKSYLGVGAFILASFAATTAFLFFIVNDLTVGSKLSLALAVSLGGAVAELFSERIDDNLTIPVLCAEIATLWFLV